MLAAVRTNEDGKEKEKSGVGWLGVFDRSITFAFQYGCTQHLAFNVAGRGLGWTTMRCAHCILSPTKAGESGWQEGFSIFNAIFWQDGFLSAEVILNVLNRKNSGL